MNVTGEWRGRVARRAESSVLADSFHRQPLKVAKPFHGPNGEVIVYLMDSSPGLFNGDRQTIACTLEVGAHLYLTNQSSCKCHSSVHAGSGHQDVCFDLMENAVLEYWPEPLVPFRDSNYSGRLAVNMSGGAQAILGDILTPGRLGRGERFDYERVWNQVIVNWNGSTAVWDSMLLEPGKIELSRQGLLGEFSHLGTVWVLSEKLNEDDLQVFREVISQEEKQGGHVYGGASRLTYGGCVIRILGHTARQIEQVMRGCWDAARERLIGMPPIAIRK